MKKGLLSLSSGSYLVVRKEDDTTDVYTCAIYSENSRPCTACGAVTTQLGMCVYRNADTANFNQDVDHEHELWRSCPMCGLVTRHDEKEIEAAAQKAFEVLVERLTDALDASKASEASLN